MNFSSDTSAPAHPAVLEALAGVNNGMQPSYGADDITARLRGELSRVLETDDFDFWLCVEIECCKLITTGTAHMLLLSWLFSRFEICYCHE